jgi:hypothetical protein
MLLKDGLKFTTTYLNPRLFNYEIREQGYKRFIIVRIEIVSETEKEQGTIIKITDKHIHLRTVLVGQITTVKIPISKIELL